jgi:hypothetical protein
MTPKPLALIAGTILLALAGSFGLAEAAPMAGMSHAARLALALEEPLVENVSPAHYRRYKHRHYRRHYYPRNRYYYPYRRHYPRYYHRPNRYYYPYRTYSYPRYHYTYPRYQYRYYRPF